MNQSIAYLIFSFIYQLTTFSNNSHIKILFPLTTTLYKTFLSVPTISNALYKATFIKTSTPTTTPSIYLPPFNFILSFLVTYLLRSGEYPCFGRALFTPVDIFYWN